MVTSLFFGASRRETAVGDEVWFTLPFSDNKTFLFITMNLNIFSGSNCEKLQLHYLTFKIELMYIGKISNPFLYPSFSNTGSALAVALPQINAWPTSMLVQH